MSVVSMAAWLVEPWVVKMVDYLAASKVVGMVYLMVDLSVVTMVE